MTPGTLNALLQQTEDRLNRGESAEALAFIAAAKKEAGEATDEPKATLSERIEDLRGEIFGAMAVIYVVHESIDSGVDYDRHRALRDAYERLNDVAAQFDEIKGDVREAVRAISNALPVQS